MARPSRTRSLQSGRRTLRATAALEAPATPSGPGTDRGIAPINTGTLPPEVARRAQREMDRLRRLPTGSPEAAQVRAYLQWLWTTPWETSSNEDADLRHVQAQLEQQHLGLTKAKERILEYLAVRRLKRDLPGPALCIVGPHGTGKTSLGSEVARALGRPFARVNVSGTSDAAELVGDPRNAPGSQPGKILRAVRNAGVRNPVLLIDGVDRLVGEGGHGVAEVLLELLDPESASQFTDHYLGVPIDLSHAVVIMCANQLELVPDALQERIEVIEVPGYSEDEKLEIARRFLLPRQLAEHGLSGRDLALGDETVRAIVRHYTLEAGVRALSRQIATLCRKVARARATGDPKRHTITSAHLEDYLGHRVYQPEMVGKEDEVGVAMGLAWTAAGGEVLVVEAIKMPGAGRVVLTGQLGDVMKESVQAAHSYVRSRAQSLDIPADAFGRFDIHVHFPAAGVPKDGPSAGITVGMVIASVLSDRAIHHDIAMTGEVSLRGNVLPVGGMREKALAAYRAGFRALLFPAANLKDVDDIPLDVREKLELMAVETMDEVFEYALSPIIMPANMNGGFMVEAAGDGEETEEVEVEIEVEEEE
ncbi:MAG: AAA family ATPase [Candidatus Eisenbacteria bacterium]|nr:AAA family ATPase [Candidatus Eisenbacteria bacterium]